MSECATEDTKGFFFGYFWAFYMASQIFGNLLAAYVLGNLSEEIFFVLMSIISLSASISFFFLKDPYSSIPTLKR